MAGVVDRAAVGFGATVQTLLLFVLVVLGAPGIVQYGALATAGLTVGLTTRTWDDELLEGFVAGAVAVFSFGVVFFATPQSFLGDAFSGCTTGMMLYAVGSTICAPAWLVFPAYALVGGPVVGIVNGYLAGVVGDYREGVSDGHPLAKE